MASSKFEPGGGATVAAGEVGREASGNTHLEDGVQSFDLLARSGRLCQCCSERCHRALDGTAEAFYGQPDLSVLAE